MAPDTWYPYGNSGLQIVNTRPSPIEGEGIVCFQEELVIQPPMTSLKRRMASMCWFAPLRPLFLVSTER